MGSVTDDKEKKSKSLVHVTRFLEFIHRITRLLTNVGSTVIQILRILQIVALKLTKKVCNHIL